MKAGNDFDHLEEKIYQEYSRDGSVELGVGYCLLCLALIIWAWPGQFWAQTSTLVVLLIPVFLLVRVWKRRITYPRLGYAQIFTRPPSLRVSRTRRRIILRYCLLILLFSEALRLAWELPSRWSSGPHLPSGKGSEWPPFENGVFTGAMAVGLAGLSVGVGGKRSWPIGVIMLSLVALSSYFQVNVGWAISLTGLLMVGMGLARLRGFLRDYPRQEETDGQ